MKDWLIMSVGLNEKLPEGVRMAVEYIMAHPELQVEDPDFGAWCDKVIHAVEDAKKAVLA